MKQRSSGVLMHISSIPSDYGIGTMGRESYKFVDFLKKSGQSYWQFLPLCQPDPAGWSPYSSYSTFSGNFCFIDFDLLEEDGYLKKSDYAAINWGSDETSVDFDKVSSNKIDVLKIAYKNWIKTNKKRIADFVKENKWADDYAMFMALLSFNDKKCWWDWKDKYKFRDEKALNEFKIEHEDDVNFWLFTQIVFLDQWNLLKQYANKQGIGLIGDIPIYVSGNSSDVWTNPDDFCLDENMMPAKVAGCPPDAFAKDGQRWGNPIYNWKKMKKENYTWWCERLRAYKNMYDVVRIDHFRGFDSYYSIDASEKTAKNGEWVKGPGIDLFNVIKDQLGEIDIIAEDLGYITDSVRELIKATGFPGMKILEMAFDPLEESDYMPHNYDSNCVVYVGTHDNDTAIGWFNGVDSETRGLCKEYLNIGLFEGVNWGMIRGSMASVAKLSVTQMQDFLGLGSEARMNVPGTVGINWKWRMKKGVATEKLAEKIYHITKMYGRI